MEGKWIWIISVSFLVVVGIVLLVLWQGTDLFVSSTSTPKSEGAKTTVHVASNNLSAARALNMESDEFAQYCVDTGTFEEADGTAVTYLCDMIEETNGTVRPPDIDSSVYKYGGIDPTSGKMVVYTWTENVLKLPTVNLTGEFDSLVFTAGEDLWSKGFNMDLESISGDQTTIPTEAQISSAVQGMLTNVQNNSTIVLGTAVMGDTTAQAKYTFDTANGSTYEAQQPLDAKHTQDISSSNQFGALRISIRHLEFEFTLNGASKFLRVVTSDPLNGYLIGDKLLKVDGEFKYYDTDTNTFTVSRPENPVTMWINGDDSEASSADSMMETIFKDITSASIVPMPIELTSMPDLSKLRDSTQTLTLTIDFISTSHVGLRGMEGTPEATVTDAEIIQNFDIQSLGLSASIVMA